MAISQMRPSSVLRTRQDDPPGGKTGSGGIYLQDLWFIVLGVFVIITALVIWFKTQRKRANFAQRTRNGRRALSQDVEQMGWAARSHHRLGRRIGGRLPQVEEGLDEAGEAPPAYNEVGDDKPPSINIRSSSGDESVRSQRLPDVPQQQINAMELQSFPTSTQDHLPHDDQPQSTTNTVQLPLTDVLTRPHQAVLAAPRGIPEGQ